MFRPIRRKKRDIGRDAAQQLLSGARIGILAVNGDDGYPYAVPINYLYDPGCEKIYFHGAKAGHKYDAITACDKVCFTVYGEEVIREEAWAPFVQSAVVFGRCRKMEATPETVKTLKQLAMKYYPEEAIADREIEKSGQAVQMFEIDIEYISGKCVQEK